MIDLPRDSFGRITADIKGIIVGPVKTTLQNATGAASRVLKAAATGQQIIVPLPEQARRMSICQTCEFFTGKTCQKCGCIALFKTRLATEKCPVGKW